MFCLGVILYYLCNDGQFTSAIDMGDMCTLCNVTFAFQWMWCVTKIFKVASSLDPK